MIVGGLLASGLALGAGTASAADGQILNDGASCTIPAVGDVLKATGVVKDANCVDAATGLVVLGTVANSVEEKAAQVEAAQKAAEKTAADQKAADQKAEDQKVADQKVADQKAADQKVADQRARDAAASRAQVQQQGQGTAVGGPAPLVAAPAGAAAGPLGTFSPAALGGIAPAGLASNLFGANAYDPGLLFGSPLGGAAAQLFTPQAGSGVTTVSQAQVLAAPGRGYGTPATIGVIILACLIGFAVRHRVISRMKARDLPEDTAPRHAAPEAEQIEDDSEARTTVLTR